MREAQPQPRATFLVSPEDYWRVIEQIDESVIREAYIGSWASREAFGQHLFSDTTAERRLADLPTWLRPYVRVDGEALVRDFERHGLYVVAETNSGVCVFDGPIVRNKHELLSKDKLGRIL